MSGTDCRPPRGSFGFLLVKNGARLIRILLVFSAFVYLSFGQSVALFACPTCKTALEGDGSAVQAGFAWSIGFMMLAPLAIGLAWLVAFVMLRNRMNFPAGAN